MGMDGLSMANTGALKESTSADFANRTEQIIQSDSSNNSKQIQNLSDNERVREREEKQQREQRQKSGKRHGDFEEEEFQDGLVEPQEDIEDNFDIEDFENPNKDFYVKLNAKDDIIELYDTETNRLIETISGNELGELVRKLNLASGIFVNKKV